MSSSWWLFYSERCAHSKAFLEAAAKIPTVAKKINKVEVEKNVGRLPSFLKGVPTLQVDDEVLSGNELFAWLEKQGIQDLSPAPMANGKGGFDMNPYSSVGDDSGDGNLFKNFTLIGTENGSSGMDKKASDVQTDANLEQLTQQRAADLRGIM